MKKQLLAILLITAGNAYAIDPVTAAMAADAISKSIPDFKLKFDQQKARLKQEHDLRLLTGDTKTSVGGDTMWDEGKNIISIKESQGSRQGM